MEQEIPETARQRFIRNNQECVRSMRVSANAARRNGDIDGGARIDEVADVWERFGQKAIQEEKDSQP